MSKSINIVLSVNEIFCVHVLVRTKYFYQGKKSFGANATRKSYRKKESHEYLAPYRHNKIRQSRHRNQLHCCNDIFRQCIDHSYM